MVLRRNILLFHTGALGDSVLTWPLTLALARIHPQSRVIVLTHAQKGALAERVLRVESSDIEAGWHHLYGNPDHLPAPAVKLLAGAHSIYSFIASPADAWCEHVRRLNGEADLCCLAPTPPAGFPAHASDYLLEQLTARPAVHEAVCQILRSINERGLIAKRTPSRRIVLHPGSGSTAKCWPAGSFLQLARRLRELGRPVRVLLGEVELERWTKDQRDALAAEAEVICPGSCVELLGALTDAAAYVGNDSGPTHLAGIIGLPTLALFGPTNPAVWHPLGPRIDILHGAPLQSLPLELVLSRLQHLLA